MIPVKVARLRVLGAPGVNGGGKPQPLRFPTPERIVAAMAEERHRVLDHALVEHRHEGLVVADHQTARHDREIGCLVGIQIQIDRISGLGHGHLPITAPMDQWTNGRRLDRVGRHLDQFDISTTKVYDLARLRIMTTDRGRTTSSARTSPTRTPAKYGMEIDRGTSFGFSPARRKAGRAWSRRSGSNPRPTP